MSVFCPTEFSIKVIPDVVSTASLAVEYTILPPEEGEVPPEFYAALADWKAGREHDLDDVLQND